MHHTFTYPAALLTMVLVVVPIKADWPCMPVPMVVQIQYESRVVTKYRTEYRTEFKEVQRTVKRQVPETVFKDVQETVKVPFWREETRQKTVMVPVTKMV